MIVLTDSFLLDPPQLSRRREVRVSSDPVYVFMLIITNLVLGKGTVGRRICSGKVLSTPSLKGIFMFQKRLNNCFKGQMYHFTFRGRKHLSHVIFCCLKLKSITTYVTGLRTSLTILGEFWNGKYYLNDPHFQLKFLNGTFCYMKKTGFSYKTEPHMWHNSELWYSFNFTKASLCHFVWHRTISIWFHID